MTIADRIEPRETYLKDSIKREGRYIIDLEQLKIVAEQRLENDARSLIDDLRKIENWDSMIQRLYSWYLSSPEHFFDDCKFTYEDNKLKVWMDGPYDNDKSVMVMEIDLDKELKQQVDEWTKQVERLEWKCG